MRKSKRSLMGIGAGALVGLCLTALSAAAQQERNVTTSKDRGDTVKVTVTGDVVLDYVYRSREMTGFTDSQGGFTAANSRSEDTFEGYVAARLGIDLSDKVSAIVEFGTKRIEGGAIVRWGQSTATNVVLREAAVMMNDFLMSDLKAQFGMTNWSFDVRGKGSAFAFDPRHSQSFSRNLTGPFEETGNGRLGLANAPEELESVGLTLSYTRNNLTFDAVFLPAALERGAQVTDEALYAIDGWYRLDDKGSRIGAIAAVNLLSAAANGTRTAQVVTLGAGVDLKNLAEGLELYIEGYFQFGKSGEDAAGDDIHAKGKAFQMGVEYHVKGESDIWFGGNITYVSGDDDLAASANDSSERFASYENVNDLMILEDQNFGFDWDSNYFAIKLMGGMSFSVGGGKNNLELMAILGFAHAAESVVWTTGSVAGEDSRRLGNEFDIKAKWHLNKQASINLGIGYLFSSTILENSMLANGASDDRALSKTFLYTLGVDLKF